MRQYPRTKFADSNSMWEQKQHLSGEIYEFMQAWSDWECAEEDGGATDVEVMAMMLEAHDIIQSAYTLMDILEREYPGQAWSALEEMVEKNRVRGYYREGK